MYGQDATKQRLSAHVDRSDALTDYTPLPTIRTHVAPSVSVELGHCA